MSESQEVWEGHKKEEVKAGNEVKEEKEITDKEDKEVKEVKEVTDMEDKEVEKGKEGNEVKEEKAVTEDNGVKVLTEKEDKEVECEGGNNNSLPAVVSMEQVELLKKLEEANR